MPGPCSLPNGGKREYAEMWFMLCNLHKDCTPDSHDEFNKNGDEIRHEFITKREWLSRRNRLRTGKTI